MSPHIKFFVSKSVSGLLCLAFASTVFADRVEVVLKDNLDGDLNGYCLDISGGGENANPENGLQAHTCYSYQGDLGVDQAVDSSSLEKGRILLIDFDVCATMPNHEQGAKVELKLCDGTDSQQFTMSETGAISPASAPGMCLTAGKDTAFGRGGTSPHQIKTLTLEVCSEEEAAYQQWYTRTQAEYDTEQSAN